MIQITMLSAVGEHMDRMGWNPWNLGWLEGMLLNPVNLRHRGLGA